MFNSSSILMSITPYGASKRERHLFNNLITSSFLKEDDVLKRILISKNNFSKSLSLIPKDSSINTLNFLMFLLLIIVVTLLVLYFIQKRFHFVLMIDEIKTLKKNVDKNKEREQDKKTRKEEKEEIDDNEAINVVVDQILSEDEDNINEYK